MRQHLGIPAISSIYYFETTNFLSRTSTIPKPVYYDLWGYPVDWTDPSDGWNHNTRNEQITLTNSIVKQSAAQQNYTEIGYMKMKIPKQLYQDILRQRQIQSLRFENCDPYFAEINCKEIRENVWHFYFLYIQKNCWMKTKD